MLKFFRRIRQKLIHEENLKRYLIYAIGEILLVMIGILLALQVSNWNQKQSDNKGLKRSLENLLLDLKKDLIAFEGLNSIYMSSQSKAESVKEIIKGKNSQEDIIRLQNIGELGNKNFEFNNGTYETLVNTGNLYKSGDHDFNLKIKEYYKEVSYSASVFDIMNGTNRNIRDQEVMLPFNYIMLADDRENGTTSPESLKWMNKTNSTTYQSVQYYTSKYIKQQKTKQDFLNKLINMNQSIQELIISFLEKDKK